MGTGLRRGRAWWELEPPSGDDDPAAVLAELRALVARVAGEGGGEVRWVVSDPGRPEDEIAAAVGLDRRRDLLQLRRPLPVEAERRADLPALSLRPFRPGHDEDGWLEVNRRAFAHHPEQGRTTLDELLALEAQPWFDPAGFLLLDGEGARAGALDGFCWTKVHEAERAPLGEIFVIGVDPARHGERLGPALTLAGLDYLQEVRAITTGMLYVEADNEPARRMYDRLGFETHHLDRVYLTVLPEN
jgi:mycothiol synthase